MVKKMQIPALFLPKGKHGQKATLAQFPTLTQTKKKKTKVAALLKGKVNGNQKNNNETRQQYRGRKANHK